MQTLWPGRQTMHLSPSMIQMANERKSVPEVVYEQLIPPFSVVETATLKNQKFLQL